MVDTAGIKTTAKVEDVPHSDALRINERMRLLDDDTLEILFTMTDPKAFKEPWVIKRQYKAYAVPFPGLGAGGPPGGGPRQCPVVLRAVAPRWWSPGGPGGPGLSASSTLEHGKYPDYKGFELMSTEVICNENNRNITDENGVVSLKLGEDE